MLVFACLSPHPPIILPNVGSEDDRARVKKTITSLEKLGKELAKAKPDCLLISSPHPDWGFNVPLHFLHPDYELPITNYLTTFNSPKEHFQWGQKIAAGLSRTKREAWIASGDMSHRLKEDGPYGFHPSGPKFDQEFIKLLKKKDISGILNLDPDLIEEAGECGLRSFCMLLGALEWQAGLAGRKPRRTWLPEILSYEAPFGVGYLVAQFKFQ